MVNLACSVAAWSSSVSCGVRVSMDACGVLVSMDMVVGMATGYHPARWQLEAHIYAVVFLRILSVP